MRGKHDTYYDLAYPVVESEGRYYKECCNCGEDIELETDCIGAVQFYNVPSEDGETECICRKCFNNWVSGVNFFKELKQLCAVKTEDIMRKEFGV